MTNPITRQTYSNDASTYYVSSRGSVYLVAGPSLPPDSRGLQHDCAKVDALPEGAVVCGSLDVPSGVIEYIEAVEEGVLTVSDEDGERTLEPVENVHGWSVIDPAGGRFWPADGSTRESAIRCLSAGEGEWHQ